MGDRISGRGRVAALIQAFEEVVDEEKAERDAVRMLAGRFDMNDFSAQVQLLEKMGPRAETAEAVHDEQLGRIGAMISSMSDDERRHPERFVVTGWKAIVEEVRGKKQGSIVYDAAYDMRRLRRVAQGSGHEVHAVVSLLNQFAMMRQLMLEIGRSSGLSG